MRPERGSLLGLFLRRDLREQWRDLLLLTVALTMACGAPMAAASAARRVESAVDRREAVVGGSDGVVVLDDPGVNPELISKIGELLTDQREIQDLETTWWAGTGLVYDEGVFANLMITSGRSEEEAHYHPFLVEGRAADPNAPNEVIVNEALADFAGLEPGDEIDLPTFDHDVWEEWLETRGAYPAFTGPELQVRVVGIARLDEDLVTNPEENLVIQGTPALRDTWGDHIGANTESVGYRLRDPATAPAVADRLRRLLPAGVTLEEGEASFVEDVRTATNLLAGALWGFTMIAAVAGAVACTGLVARRMEASAATTGALRPIGLAQGERSGLRAASTIAAGGIAAVGGAAIAIVMSPWTSFGYAERVEPDPGVAIDPLVTSIGVAIGLGATTVLALWKARSADRRAMTGERSGYLRLGATASEAGLPLGLGARAALHARSGVVAATLALGTVVAVSVLVASAEELVDTPTRWGWTWSSLPDLGFEGEQYPAAYAALERDPDLNVGNLSWAQLDIGNEVIEVIEVENVDVKLLEGRLPNARSEVALARRTARDLGLGVGARFPVRNASGGSVSLDVVGVVIPPYTPGGHHPGEGALVSYDHEMVAGLAGENRTGSSAVLTYVDGVDPAAVEARLADDPGWVFLGRSRPRLPAAILNLERASPVLPWLVVFITGMWVIRFVHGTVISQRRSRRDIEALVALGLRPRQVRWLFVARCTTVVVIGLGLGSVLGAALGAEVTAFALDDLGLQTEVALPGLALAGLAVLLVSMSAMLGWRTGVLATRPSARELRQRE